MKVDKRRLLVLLMCAERDRPTTVRGVALSTSDGAYTVRWNNCHGIANTGDTPPQASLSLIAEPPNANAERSEHGEEMQGISRRSSSQRGFSSKIRKVAKRVRGP